MSKGLEAWERVELYCENNSSLEHLLDDLEIIEKELKRLEEIDDVLNTGGGIWAENGIVSKELKALEIIKKYPFVVNLNFRLNYNEQIDLVKYQLTQEEYGLLKGVLL